MRTRLAMFIAVCAAAILLSRMPVGAAQDRPGRSVWDGIYAESQAGRGAAVFNDKCAKCHAADLGGGDAPALTGREFAMDWDGLTVAQLFDRVFTSMPQDAPRSLSREETAAVLAYILQKNSFPAGQTDLTDQMDVLKQIQYAAKKP